MMGYNEIVSTNRNNSFDFFKGLLIFGVVYGHVIKCLLDGAPNHIHLHWILRTFDMPLFMIISGYFLSFSVQRYTLKDLILNKLTTLFIPIVIFNYFGIYFLWAVFFSSIVIASVSYIKCRSIKWILIICILIVSQLIDKYNISYLFPFFLTGFYHIGIDNFSNKKKNFIIIAFVILLCFWSQKWTIWNLKGNLLNISYPEDLFKIGYRFLIGFTGSISMLKLFDLLLISLESTDKRISSFFVKIGKETLALYCLQSIVIFRIGVKIIHTMNLYFGGNYFLYNESFLGYILAPSLSYLLIKVLMIIIGYIKKGKYSRIIFGEKCKNLRIVFHQ